MPKEKMGGTIDPEGYQSSLVPKEGLANNFATLGEKEEDKGLYHAQKGQPGGPAGRWPGWSK